MSQFEEDVSTKMEKELVITPDGEEVKTEEKEDDYKISDKATGKVDEILQQDAEDESLRKYKEQLLGAAAHGDLGDVNDPRRVIIKEFKVTFEDSSMPDIVFNLDTPEGLELMSTTGITLKEGCKYKFTLSFRVQHELVPCIKYVNKLKRGIFSISEELVLGSYAPQTALHTFEFPRWGFNEAPKGMMYRGKYVATDKFVDSEKVCHLEYSYPVNITK